MSLINLQMNIANIFNRLSKVAAFGLATLMLMVAITPGVVAAAISQGYRSNEPLTAGTLVSSDKNDQSGLVIPANIDNADNLMGVVVSEQDATLSVTNPSDSLQVATNGSTQALVTDIGGEIKAGDSITASPVSGIGMKANDNVKIVGVAQADAKFNGKTTKVKNKTGGEETINVGTVPVIIQVSFYVPETKKSPVPEALQLFVDSIAGKQVALERLVASAAIVLAAVITIAILLYSAIHNSMISIGRNPLAQGSIYRGLWQVIITSLIIFIVALASAYFVLTR